MAAQHSDGPAPSRAQLLRIGGLGCLGLSLSKVLRAEASTASGRPAASIRSCILIFYYGGPSHLDTWDMKPGAPLEVRGEFQSIATRRAGPEDQRAPAALRAWRTGSRSCAACTTR